MASVLFCSVTDPEYLLGGNAIRDHFLIRELSREHRVTVLCPPAPTTGSAFRSLSVRKVSYDLRWKPVALARGLLPGHLFQVEYRVSPSGRKTREVFEDGPYDVLWSSMLYPMASRLAKDPALREAVVVWDTHNNDEEVFSAAARRGGLNGAYHRMQIHALRRQLRRAADRAQIVIACTHRDADSIQRLLGIPRPVVAANGVDLSTWQRPETQTCLDTGAGKRFAVFGSLFTNGYTARGIAIFLKDHWASIQRRWPDARLVVAGSGPDDDLRRLCGRTDGVSLIPDPNDMAGTVCRATHVLVPQYGGQGSKIKMFESIASGLPVVATPHALVGLDQDMHRLVSLVQQDDWPRAIENARPYGGHEESGKALISEFDWSKTLRPAVETLRHV